MFGYVTENNEGLKQALIFSNNIKSKCYRCCFNCSVMPSRSSYYLSVLCFENPYDCHFKLVKRLIHTAPDSTSQFKAERKDSCARHICTLPLKGKPKISQSLHSQLSLKSHCQELWRMSIFSCKGDWESEYIAFSALTIEATK